MNCGKPIRGGGTVVKTGAFSAASHYAWLAIPACQNSAMPTKYKTQKGHSLIQNTKHTINPQKYKNTKTPRIPVLIAK